MKARIKALNAAYIEGLDLDSYKAEAGRMLNGMDWQKRIQYDNMLLVTV